MSNNNLNYYISSHNIINIIILKQTHKYILKHISSKLLIMHAEEKGEAIPTSCTFSIFSLNLN